jgi:hypothetical protein
MTLGESVMQELKNTDEQHLRALEEIRAQVGDMFQGDAEFSSSPPYLILLLDWPLHDQPEFMAERSNQVALAFSPEWLDEFIKSGDGGTSRSWRRFAQLSVRVCARSKREKTFPLRIRRARIGSTSGFVESPWAWRIFTHRQATESFEKRREFRRCCAEKNAHEKPSRADS